MVWPQRYCISRYLCEGTLDLNASAKSKTHFMSKSHKLFSQLKFYQPCGNGLFAISPLLQLSMRKLTRLIHRRMRDVGAVQIQCSLLGEKDMWDKTGRWNLMEGNLLKIKDRTGAEFCLQPTHEEAVTRLVAATAPVAQRSLPMLLYQITNKYRDELNPRFGLLRSREFLMKDLYSFDADADDAKRTYDSVVDAYSRLFHDDLRLPVQRASASSGAIGGHQSHEFILPHPVGQDTVCKCPKCCETFNIELSTTTTTTNNTSNNNNNTLVCPNCSSTIESSDTWRGFELAHTFLLGEKYARAFGATSWRSVPLQMGCYGIGIGRVLAAAIDYLSEDDRLIWPSGLAPVSVAVIPPKRGSHEEQCSSQLVSDLIDSLIDSDIDFLIDDRVTHTIGRRSKAMRMLGVPYVLIIGKLIKDDIPKFELLRTRTNTCEVVTHAQLFDFLRSHNCQLRNAQNLE